MPVYDCAKNKKGIWEPTMKNDKNEYSKIVHKKIVNIFSNSVDVFKRLLNTRTKKINQIIERIRKNKNQSLKLVDRIPEDGEIGLDEIQFFDPEGGKEKGDIANIILLLLKFNKNGSCDNEQKIIQKIKNPEASWGIYDKNGKIQTEIKEERIIQTLNNMLKAGVIKRKGNKIIANVVFKS